MAETLKIDFRHAKARDAKPDIRRITFGTLDELSLWMKAHPSLGNGQPVDFDIAYEDEDGDTILVGSEIEWSELLLQRSKGFAKKLRCYWSLLLPPPPSASSGGIKGSQMAADDRSSSSGVSGAAAATRHVGDDDSTGRPSAAASLSSARKMVVDPPSSPFDEQRTVATTTTLSNSSVPQSPQSVGSRAPPPTTAPAPLTAAARFAAAAAAASSAASSVPSSPPSVARPTSTTTTSAAAAVPTKAAPAAAAPATTTTTRATSTTAAIITAQTFEAVKLEGLHGKTTEEQIRHLISKHHSGRPALRIHDISAVMEQPDPASKSGISHFAMIVVAGSGAAAAVIAALDGKKYEGGKVLRVRRVDGAAAATGPSSSSTSAAAPATSKATDTPYETLEVECCMCLEVFTDPCRLPCGHVGCRDCLRQLHSRTCPQCRADFTEEDLHGTMAAEFLRRCDAAVVKCRSKGCKWSGPRHTLAAHMEVCVHHQSSVYLARANNMPALPGATAAAPVVPGSWAAVANKMAARAIRDASNANAGKKQPTAAAAAAAAPTPTVNVPRLKFCDQWTRALIAGFAKEHPRWSLRLNEARTGGGIAIGVPGSGWAVLAADQPITSSGPRTSCRMCITKWSWGRSMLAIGLLPPHADEVQVGAAIRRYGGCALVLSPKEEARWEGEWRVRVEAAATRGSADHPALREGLPEGSEVAMHVSFSTGTVTVEFFVPPVMTKAAAVVELELRDNWGSYGEVYPAVGLTSFGDVVEWVN